MNEILEKRNYNQHHYDNGDGTFLMRAFSGHVNYLDKFGDGAFKEIDHTLSWDEENQGWFFETHSFHPFLPLFADDWVEFRDVFQNKDQTIRYKASCAHVKGRLVQPEEAGLERQTNMNAVIYDDAFGEGIDYILYFHQMGLVKSVRIRNKFKEVKDYAFEFQIDIPSNLSFLRAEKQIQNLVVSSSPLSVKNIEAGVEPVSDSTSFYEVDKTKAKTFDTNKSSFIGELMEDGTEGYTYLQPFKAWDSREVPPKQEMVKVDFYNKDGLTFIRKNVSADFMKDTIGDVFTDTTTDYNVGYDRAIGSIGSTGTWSTAHGQATGDGGYTAAGAGYVQTGYDTGVIYLYRFLMDFDTSGIGSGQAISAATMNIKPNSKNAGAANIIHQIYGHTATANPYTNADFDEVTLTADTAYSSTTIRYNDLTAGTYSVWTLNATGIAAINMTGHTKMCCRDGSYDAPNTDPTNAVAQQSVGFENTASGAGKLPYIEATYAPAAAAYKPALLLMILR